jgi:hypothetical protein
MGPDMPPQLQEATLAPMMKSRRPDFGGAFSD